MRREVILRVVVQFLFPYLLLFALYVQFHGDYGPGGGFQAGVMFAATLILYGLVCGFSLFREMLPHSVLRRIAGIGVLIFGGTGVASMMLGGKFLEYGVFDPHDPAHGNHYGILLIELGVGITVAAVMLLIFHAFASREAPK